MWPTLDDARAGLLAAREVAIAGADPAIGAVERADLAARYRSHVDDLGALADAVHLGFVTLNGRDTTLPIHLTPALPDDYEIVLPDARPTALGATPDALATAASASAAADAMTRSLAQLDRNIAWLHADDAVLAKLSELADDEATAP